MTESAVLFVTFARPDYARQTFDAIKKAKPKKFYFYSNKGRVDKPDELKRNDQVRAFIDEIDWDCDLKIYFREEYVDVYTSLWGAYDWVFDNEEQAIILEEDCLPSLAFFDFCDQLLPKYKDDQRVWVISGNNFIEGYNPNGYDYIFTRYPYQYGWASWRSRWVNLERKAIPWNEMINYDLFYQLFPSKKQAKYQIEKESKIISFIKNKPAWDYIFGLNIKMNGGFGIVPTINLVSNIGLIGEHNSGNHSVFHVKHTSNEESYMIKNEPIFILPDYKYDQFFFKKIYLSNTFIHKRLKRKIIKLFKIIFKMLLFFKKTIRNI